MKILLSIALLLLSTTTFASAESDVSYEVVDTEELAELLRTQPQMILLDVRDTNELVSAAGSIRAEQNIHIPIDWLTIKEVSKNKDTLIVVYCATGQRSPRALTILKNLGYTHVMSYAEGYAGWKDAGMPIK